MAFDSVSGQAVLHGGIGPGYVSLNDTWVYDAGANTWTNVAGPVRPATFAAYTTQSMAYDPTRNRVLLYGGGLDPYALPNGTWSFNPNTFTWTNLNPPTPGPGASHDSSLVYDARADRFLLFGGGNLAPHFYSDGSNTTWAYNWTSNTWTDLKPARSPPARFGQGMAYDSAAERVILYGGCVQTGYEMCTGANDTWAFDYGNNTWTNLTPFTSPPRWLGALVYDQGADRTILYNGPETWAYDFGTNRWIDQAPVVSPGSRSSFALAYDSTHGNTLLFGGLSYAGALNDTWTYTYGTVTPTAPAAPRMLAATPAPGQVTLTWQAPAKDGGYPVIAYRIYRGMATGTEAFLTQVGNVLTYTDTGLTTLTNYYYEVSAVNAAGEGPRSNEASAAPPDRTNPSVAIQAPAEGATVPVGSVPIRGTASDDVAVQAVEISTDYVTWRPVNGTTAWRVNLTFSAGHARIWAMAIDTSGNRGIASVNFTVGGGGGGSNGTSAPTGGGTGLPVLGIEVAALVSIGLVAAVAIAFTWRRRWRREPPA